MTDEGDFIRRYKEAARRLGASCALDLIPADYGGYDVCDVVQNDATQNDNIDNDNNLTTNLGVYLSDLREYIGALRKAAVLRQEHYEKFIKGRRDEEPGHTHWRVSLNRAVEIAEEMLARWEIVWNKSFDADISISDALDRLDNFDVCAENVDMCGVECVDTKRVDSIKCKDTTRKPKMSLMEAARRKKLLRAEKNARDEALLDLCVDREQHYYQGCMEVPSTMGVVLFDVRGFVRSLQRVRDSTLSDFSKANEFAILQTYNSVDPAELKMFSKCIYGLFMAIAEKYKSVFVRKNLLCAGYLYFIDAWCAFLQFREPVPVAVLRGCIEGVLAYSDGASVFEVMLAVVVGQLSAANLKFVVKIIIRALDVPCKAKKVDESDLIPLILSAHVNSQYFIQIVRMGVLINGGDVPLMTAVYKSFVRRPIVKCSDYKCFDYIVAPLKGLDDLFAGVEKQYLEIISGL